MYLVDYHVHTKRCRHAGGTDREYVETAVARGLKEIGFADHTPRFYQAPDPNQKVNERGMWWEDFEGYVRSVTDLRAEYRDRIQVKLGLEVDYVRGWEREVERIAAQYPFDYLTGSVHFFPEWNYGYIVSEKERGPEEIYPVYFEKVAEAAESGLFDILAHVDLPKQAFRRLSPTAMAALHQQLALRLGKAGAVIELNTNGIRSGRLGDAGVHPDKGLLKLCRDQGVRVTLGSDAHRPKDVAADFDRSLGLLEEFGFEEIQVFTGRKGRGVRWNEG